MTLKIISENMVSGEIPLADSDDRKSNTETGSVLGGMSERNEDGGDFDIYNGKECLITPNGFLFFLWMSPFSIECLNLLK